MSMRVRIDPRIFGDFDNPRIGVLVVRGTDNTKPNSSLVKQLNNIAETISDKYQSETLSKAPVIAAWREAHRKFGSKPKDYPNSVEALYKRILKRQNIGSINPLVDIYNYISLKYMLTAGGEDLDKVEGDLQLTYATNNEVPVVVLGKDEEQVPFEGEIIYKDDIGTICRRWNWREVARTILTDKTTNAVLVLEALNPVTDQILHEAINELENLVDQYCGGTISSVILDKDKKYSEV